MYLHLGRDIVVSRRTIVGIFDFDTATYGKRTREFLTKAQKEGQVVTVSDELPKSAVVCEEDGLYLPNLLSDPAEAGQWPASAGKSAVFLIKQETSDPPRGLLNCGGNFHRTRGRSND